jgi:hypothetical protein
MIIPPRSRRRCKTCHWQVAIRGHSPGCRVGLCVRCKDFAKLPGSSLCAWCTSRAQRERYQAYAREIAIANRLAALDRGEI